MKYKIVETDNFGGDYPNEKSLPVPPLEKEAAESIASLINEAAGLDCSRYWKVELFSYKLQPGFQP